MEVTCRYFLDFFTSIFPSLANALAFSLFARWFSADHATDSKGYLAHKGNLMADDDVTIVDCGATQHSSQTLPSCPRSPTPTRDTR